ncbi:armadillo-type protein [Entophlyctis helioformis]|nr:armadillo-type protein [Entophlyctis helioformis]
MGDFVALQQQFETAVVQLEQPSLRVQGEQVIKEFKRLPNLLPACKHILENSQEVRALFHAAVALQDSIARIYRQMPSLDEQLSLRQYLVAFMMQRSSLPNYVMQKLAQTAAIAIKVGYLTDPDAVKDQAMQQIAQLTTQPGVSQRLASVLIVVALLDEFSASKATPVGLPYDHHRDCQTMFERSHQRFVFETLLRLIHLEMQDPASLTTNSHSMIVHNCLLGAERILSWTPAAENAASLSTLRRPSPNADEEDSNDLPRFPAVWRDLLLAPAVIGLFFELNLAYFAEARLSKQARRCLVQLAGLHGEVFAGPEDRRAYAAHFIEQSLKQLAYLQHAIANNPPANIEDHLLDMAQIGTQLLTNFKAGILVGVPAFRQYLDGIGKITITCLQTMTEDDDESWSGEVAEELLAMWSSLVYDLEFMSDDDQRLMAANAGAEQVAAVAQYLPTVTFDIFKAYVEVRLKLAQQAIDDDDIVDNHFKDLDLFGDQLMYIGSIARLSCDKSLTLLGQMLVERHHALALIFSSPNLSSQGLESDLISEQIHWLTLIAGHVLADAADGEKPMIPRSLLQLSLAMQQGNDPCIGLPTCLFNILDLLTVEPGSPQSQACSPLLVETLLWFVQRWGCTYLFVDPSDYERISPSILNAFGSSGGAPQALNFLLDKIQRNFVIWHAEADVVCQIVAVLDGFAANKFTRDALIQSPKFNEVVQFFLANLERLPASVHSDLIRTIAYIITHTSGVQRESYFQNMSQAIEEMLNAVIHRPDFGSVYQSAQMCEQVINIMDMYNGLVLAMDETNMGPIFDMCAKQFDAFVRLLDLYHSFPEVEFYILQFFRDLVKFHALDVLEDHHYRDLYRASMELIRVYAKNEIGRKRSRGRGTDEEDLNIDLSVLLEMLAGLISSEYEGLARQDVLDRQAKTAAHGGADVVQVVFFGVNELIPLITDDMLSFPRLCSDFINLVSNLVEYFPNKLAQLPSELLAGLVKSLVSGVNQPMSALSVSALRAMESLALYLWAESIKHAHAGVDMATLYPSLSHQMDYLLHQTLLMVVYKPLDSQMIEAASCTLFALAIARKATYQALVQRLVAQQPPAAQARLSAHFAALTASIEAHEAVQQTKLVNGSLQIGLGGSVTLSSSRDMVPFRAMFSRFLGDVRGLLLHM